MESKGKVSDIFHPKTSPRDMINNKASKIRFCNNAGVIFVEQSLKIIA